MKGDQRAIKPPRGGRGGNPTARRNVGAARGGEAGRRRAGDSWVRDPCVVAALMRLMCQTADALLPRDYVHDEVAEAVRAEIPQMIDAIVDGWMETEPETRGEAGKCTVKWMARPATAATTV